MRRAKGWVGGEKEGRLEVTIEKCGKESNGKEMQGDKELEALKISPSFVDAVAVCSRERSKRSTLLCSVHAPGISQLADRPHVPCGEAIPENGRALGPWMGLRARGEG
jgi:hypothetical protein